MKFFTPVFILLWILPSWCDGMHIIGGELYYTCLGSDNYEITLKVYRDCNSTTTFDDTAIVGIYNENGVLIKKLLMFFPGSTGINPDLSNPCLQIPPGVCVEEAVYKEIENLPSIIGGYDLSYQRCCRNNTIVNIVDPQNTGATYTAHIPESIGGACNSSPRFTNFPPIVICVDEQLVFDHSATDPDGDQLVYSLFTPYEGAGPLAPKPNPPPPPPYDPINWQTGYNLNNQIGGSPPMSIDPVTGVLTAYPTALGQYVVGICVKEYRNGVFLDQDTRDFQFNITTCNPLIEANFTALNTINTDTLLICGSFTANFTNLSYGSNSFQWDFGVPGITTDVSTDVNPTYTYPDTGVYHVMLGASPGLICGDTIFKYVEIRLGLTADFSFQNGCVSSPFLFTDQSVPLDGQVSVWDWDFGDGSASTQQNVTHVYGSEGFYNVKLTAYNSYGCSAEITKTVQVFPLPVVTAGPDTFICDVDSVTLSSQGGVSYQWVPDYNINDVTLANPLVKPDVTTVYTVTATDANGCSATNTATVMVTDTVIAITNNDTTICQGSPVQLYAINGVYYSWTPPDGISNTSIASPVATPSVTTTYYITSYIGSCFDEDTVTITVLPVPLADAGIDTTINQGESVVLNGSGGTIYQWTPADYLDDPSLAAPTANPLNTTVYTLTVGSSNGCNGTDTVTVNVTHLHLFIVPNAFTPNGDGLNDYFQFYTKGIEKILSVKVFNRWGQLIYYSSGNDEGWNGTYKEAASEMGVYVYDISGITYDGDVLNQKGSLTLLR